jgi:hypothetical protein
MNKAEEEQYLLQLQEARKQACRKISINPIYFCNNHP